MLSRCTPLSFLTLMSCSLNLIRIRVKEKLRPIFASDRSTYIGEYDNRTEPRTFSQRAKDGKTQVINVPEVNPYKHARGTKDEMGRKTWMDESCPSVQPFTSFKSVVAPHMSMPKEVNAGGMTTGNTLERGIWPYRYSIATQETAVACKKCQTETPFNP